MSGKKKNAASAKVEEAAKPKKQARARLAGTAAPAVVSSSLIGSAPGESVLEHAVHDVLVGASAAPSPKPVPTKPVPTKPVPTKPSPAGISPAKTAPADATPSKPSSGNPPEPTQSTQAEQPIEAGSDPFGFGPLLKSMPVPDFEVLSRNMHQLVEESGRVATTLYDAAERSPGVRADVADAVQTLGQVAEHWFADPARLMQAQAALTTQFFDLWAKSVSRNGGAAPSQDAPIVSAAPADKRFRDPAWRETPYFDFIHKAFLLGSSFAGQLIDGAETLDETTREKARFYVRQITSALSPSNFVPTNPELLRETLKESGGNLLRGMRMLGEDLAAGRGQLRIRHTDTSQFKLGINMALTPGKVVFRNDLMELLQYAPSTPEVLKRPLLIVPPWINKFYVLDLNPEKSFIRWAVEQGLTVFVVSWVNPDERHAEKDFESYMREGIFAALDEIAAITAEQEVTTIGYCVGGTLLAVALAYMAATGDTRISSATLFTAQVDFTHAGDLKVFADAEQIKTVEAQMQAQGFLRGSHMAQAFNMLRPEELIWSYWVNNYLRGKEPPAFDLLAWNSDSTRMPAANHAFYLRNCYLENNLAKGLVELGGRRLDIKQVTTPIYNLATREDHIAPALSVFEGSKAFGGPVRYVLSGSGHVAGVVNPPARGKYDYVVGPEPTGSFQDWLGRATEHKGSWWPDWFEWVRAQAPATVPAREPGGGRPTLGDAPGSYVEVKA